MTIIFEDIQAKKPQTHFFIVGVGAYRHLIGGTGPILDDPMGLKQLSSPPLSAVKFADWAIKEFQNPDAQLGSVELLLSSTTTLQDSYTTPSGMQIPIERALFNNIRAAFYRWRTRCNSDRRNIAIFYFCGHGVMKKNLALLAEDFGEIPDLCFDNAIDFEMTYRGMSGCQARTQCYFVDSCRRVPHKVLRLLEVNARPLVDSSLNDEQPEDAPILYASSRKQGAYSLPNSTTRFTDALIKSLQGLGAKRVRGQWVITTDRLAEAVIQTIERGNEEAGVPKQECKRAGEGKGTSVLHILKAQPSVPLKIDIHPTDALSFAEITLLKGTGVHGRRSPLPSAWQLSVLADTDYEAHAQFSSGKYLNPVPIEIWALPPYVDERFEVEANS